MKSVKNQWKHFLDSLTFIKLDQDHRDTPQNREFLDSNTKDMSVHAYKLTQHHGPGQGPVSLKSRNCSGDIILFVSSKRRCSVSVILMFIPFTTYEKKRPASQSKRVGVSRMAFRARKVFESFEKRTARCHTVKSALERTK